MVYVRLHVGFTPPAPIAGFELFARIIVAGEGLDSPTVTDEDVAVGEIEEFLMDRLNEDPLSMLVAVLRRGSALEFVYYTHDAETLKKVFAEAEKKFQPRPLWLELVEDPKWERYMMLKALD